MSKKQAVSDLWSTITKEAYLDPCQLSRETTRQVNFFWGEIYNCLTQIFPPISTHLEDNKSELIHLIETKHIIELYRQILAIDVWKACLKTVLLFVDSANFCGSRRYIKCYGPFKLYTWVQDSKALLQYKNTLQDYLNNDHNYLFYIKKIDFVIKQSARNFYHHIQQVSKFHLSLLYLIYHFPVAVIAIGKEVMITHPGITLRNFLNKFPILKLHTLFQLYFTVSNLRETNSSRLKCLEVMQNDSHLQNTDNVEIALSHYLNMFYRLTEVSNPIM